MRHQRNSQEEFYSCRCSTTFPVERKTKKQNVWQRLFVSIYARNFGTGHSLVQVLKRSGPLRKRIAHKEFWIISRTRCCWNSKKADVLFSVQQPSVISKANDTENCLYILLQMNTQLRHFSHNCSCQSA